MGGNLVVQSFDIPQAGEVFLRGDDTLSCLHGSESLVDEVDILRGEPMMVREGERLDVTAM